MLALLILAFGSPAAAGAEPDVVPKVAAVAQPETALPSIESIRAYFYYHETGTLGTEDLTSGRLALRNVFIGEGAADHPSSTTFVVVTVKEGSSSGVTPGTLEFVALDYEDKKTAESTVLLASYSAQSGRIAIPFVVHGTGCGDVTLKAAIVTPDGARSELTERVEFVCGE